MNMNIRLVGLTMSIFKKEGKEEEVQIDRKRKHVSVMHHSVGIL